MSAIYSYDALSVELIPMLFVHNCGIDIISPSSQRLQKP
jgi:hypothetical protein